MHQMWLRSLLLHTRIIMPRGDGVFDYQQLQEQFNVMLQYDDATHLSDNVVFCVYYFFFMLK
ncbi:hypothetical protein, partial [Legionella sp.]|uniref:hypothetical protein n=1 Tax=Legionella sp. TaxID=459 RepID=UPI003C978A4B